MKNIFLNKIIWLALAAMSFASCQKDEVDLYQQNAGIYFNGRTLTYTFVENIPNFKLGADTVNLPLLITGEAVDHDRIVEVVEAVEDTITASKDMYEVLGGVVKAGEYKGFVKVKINYVPAMDDSVYVTKFKLRSSDEFPVTDLNHVVYKLYMTNKMTQPSNWIRLRSTFGEYSNSWYHFILETTGLSSIPYWSYRGSADPRNPDPERWTMTRNELDAYKALVKEALAKYNNAHPGDPMKHQDGEFKGTVITMR